MSDENKRAEGLAVSPEKKKLKKHKPNTSGTGKNCIVPEAVAKRFNWGAFFLTWIWGIGNKTYKTFLIFLSLIPYIGILISLPLQIWFGIKGNEWAWRNKKFKGINDFHKYQKKWAIVATVLFITGSITTVLIYAVFFTFYMKNAHLMQYSP